MDKKMLRQRAKEQLSKIPAVDKLRIEEALLQHLTLTAYWQSAAMIAITVSLPHEWDTNQIIQRAWLDNKKLCVPKMMPGKQLQFYLLTSYNQLKINDYGILEPEIQQDLAIDKGEIDLLIAPGLLFDQKGFRLGYGGGYYDRYLSDYQGAVLSLCSSQQVVNELPADQFDQKIDHLITENGIVF